MVKDGRFSMVWSLFLQFCEFYSYIHPLILCSYWAVSKTHCLTVACLRHAIERIPRYLSVNNKNVFISRFCIRWDCLPLTEQIWCVDLFDSIHVYSKRCFPTRRNQRFSSFTSTTPTIRRWTWSSVAFKCTTSWTWWTSTTFLERWALVGVCVCAYVCVCVCVWERERDRKTER